MAKKAIVEYEIKGMDRLENVMKNMPIYESLTVLIDSIIKNNKGIQHIFINEEIDSIK